MKLLKSIFLLSIATVIMLILAVPVFVIRVFSKCHDYQYLVDYIKCIAIGLDQLGGAILYHQENWTVSSYTFYLAHQNKYAGRYYYFMRLIDLLFGKNHCVKSYEWEIEQHQKEVKRLKI